MSPRPAALNMPSFIFACLNISARALMERMQTSLHLRSYLGVSSVTRWKQRTVSSGRWLRNEEKEDRIECGWRWRMERVWGEQGWVVSTGVKSGIIAKCCEICSRGCKKGDGEEKVKRRRESRDAWGWWYLCLPWLSLNTVVIPPYPFSISSTIFWPQRFSSQLAFEIFFRASVQPFNKKKKKKLCQTQTCKMQNCLLNLVNNLLPQQPFHEGTMPLAMKMKVSNSLRRNWTHGFEVACVKSRDMDCSHCVWRQLQFN